MRVSMALLAGSAIAVAARAALPRLLAVKFRRDLARLKAGDYRPLLAGYADDAVLVFPNGSHRFAGEHRGKEAIERFLQNFTAAGLQGELRELYAVGPPWRLTLIVRFDDRAVDDEGRELYRNRAVLLVRTRWGRIVLHEDFFEDTSRIETLETRLQAT